MTVYMAIIEGNNLWVVLIALNKRGLNSLLRQAATRSCTPLVYDYIAAVYMYDSFGVEIYE